MKKRILLSICLFITGSIFLPNKSYAQIQNADVLNAPIDISKDFNNYLNTFYFADELTSFDPELAEKEEVIIVTKSDLLEPGEGEKLAKKVKEWKGKKIFVVSVYDIEAMKKLSDGLVQMLK